jgi:hypothetical protein
MRVMMKSIPYRCSVSRERWAALGLVGVMLLRGLIPAGFMADTAAVAAGGMIQLVICTGGGLKGANIPADRDAPVSADDDCAFANAAAPIILPAIGLSQRSERAGPVAGRQWRRFDLCRVCQLAGMGARAPPIAV